MTVLAATVALAAMTSATHGATFGMTISPAVIAATGSQSSGSFVVTDSGKTNIRVDLSAMELHRIAGTKHSWAPSGKAGFATFAGPSSFTLKPGEYRKVSVKMAIHDDWRHDVGIAATGRPADAKEGMATATIARYILNPNAKEVPSQATLIPAAKAPTHHGQSPVVPLSILASLVLAIGYLTRRVVKRFRKVKVHV